MVDNEYSFRAMYEQSWPMPTMSREEYEETRGCKDRSVSCPCYGQCPVRMKRIFDAKEHDAKRRDWRHNRRWR